MAYSIDAAIQRGRNMINAGWGYSQGRRWEEGLRDCSSFVIDCIDAGGLHLGDGYTGTLHDQLISAGWTCYDYDGNLSDCDRGGVLLRSSDLHGGDGHTVMVSEYGSRVIEAASDDLGCVERDIYQWGWDWFFAPPACQAEPEPEPEPVEALPYAIQYQVQGQSGKWYDWMEDLVDTGGSSDTFAGNGEPIIAIRCRLVKR